MRQEHKEGETVEETQRAENQTNIGSNTQDNDTRLVYTNYKEPNRTRHQTVSSPARGRDLYRCC